MSLLRFLLILTFVTRENRHFAAAQAVVFVTTIVALAVALIHGSCDLVSVLKWTSCFHFQIVMLPDADLSDPDIEDCLDDEIIFDPMALHESDYSNESYTNLMLLY